MKQTSPKPHRFTSRVRAELAAAAVLSLLGITALQAQTEIINDNFEDQTDQNPPPNNWIRYNLGDVAPYGAAHFSFPANPAGPSGNYAYKILADPTWYAPANGDPGGLGNARAGSFRTNDLYGFTRFEFGVDLV